jgi:O-antigen/teichoic acid export membrane protein
MKQSQLIARNMTIIVLSEMVGFGLHFVVTVLVARYLGTEGFGKYSFVLAFVWVFQLIADLGLSKIMVREISVKKGILEYQLGVTKSLIWILSLVVFGLIVLTVNIINCETILKNAIYIMGLAVIATVHAVGYSSVFRAMEEMEYTGIGFVMHKVLLLISTVIVIYYRGGLIEITLVNLICNLMLWAGYYVAIRIKYCRPRLIINVQAWRYFVLESLPIGIASILRKISLQVDVLILAAIASTSAVGLFSAPYKIIQATSLLPDTLTIALFPHFSRLAQCSYRELFHVYEKNLKFMCLLSVPIVVILSTLSQGIILLVYGERFANAHLALQILSVSLIFLFQTSQFVYLFSALGKQRLFTVCSFGGLVVNIVLDFLLIPEYDFIGACFGTLVAEMALFGIGVYFIKATDKEISFIRASWKSFASGILMAIVLYQFKDSSLPWMAFGVLVSSLVYVLSAIVLRVFSSSEIETIRESIMFLKRKSCPLPSIQNSEAK